MKSLSIVCTRSSPSFCCSTDFPSITDNKRGNQGVDKRKDSRIIGLRSCNNWIKAVMIQTYVRRRPDRPWSGREPNGRVLDMGCGKGGDIAKWDNANIQEYVGVGKCCSWLLRQRIPNGDSDLTSVFPSIRRRCGIHRRFQNSSARDEEETEIQS